MRLFFARHTGVTVVTVVTANAVSLQAPMLGLHTSLYEHGIHRAASQKALAGPEDVRVVWNR